MAKYLIHCCEKRKWYVDNFLLPSMLKQGIERTDIMVYNDASNKGCLQSFISSIDMITETKGGTWHLQDDIIISSNFKEITEEFDKGIVCGFCSYYSEDAPVGIRTVQNMWYSFPCIRIPNQVVKNFIKWLSYPRIQTKYTVYIGANKFVDSLFRWFLLEMYSHMFVHNLYPNIVDNVDYLIGGTTINHQREKKPVSLYFAEDNLVEELKCSIENSVYKRT